MRIFIYPLLLVTSFVISIAIQAQQKINIDDNWKFHLGHAANPEKDFNYSIVPIFSKSGGAANTAIDPSFSDSSWATVDIPHDWAVHLPFENASNFDVMSHGYKPVGGLFPQNSIGWYRKHFSVNKKDSNDRFSIQFDGVFRNASFWLNGFYLGTNQSGYVGITYDVTNFIKFDKENVLVARVDATQYEGWFYEGAGIYRHVWLNQSNKLHFKEDDFFVHAAVKEKDAVVTIESTIENKNYSEEKCSVYSYITNRNGDIIASTAEQQISVSENGNLSFKHELKVDGCHLWNLDDPYLYRAYVAIKMNGKIVHQISTRFGIRTLAFDANKGFFLNGEHVKIKGTCNHQDHAGVGSALPDFIQYYRIKKLKEMGSNAYRTSHNAPTPELLDACDSLGMLVMDEQRLLNSSPEYINQFERLLKRDRNHPSVFMWSIGNEEGWIQTTEHGRKIAQDFISFQKKLDPTRTCTYGADLANVFQGINQVIPVRGFNYRQYGVADYHKDHPEQLLIGSEMGSTVTTRGIYEKDSIRAYLPDQDITAPWWASKAEDWWTLAANDDYWMGGFVWTGFDYRGEPTPYQWPNINSHFGIMDVCGFPKNIYYYYKSWWRNEDVLHISPHWNWPEKKGKTIEVWVNSNAEEVELFLNGKSLGKKKMQANSHLKWNVIYEPGTLKAIGYKNGRKIKATVETTGQPKKLQLTADKNTITANGKDGTIVNVIVVDDKGREVPDANNNIKFNITGDAKIIGTGNGDPSSHQSDKCTPGNWERSLFNGKCQIIILSGNSKGNINITATATGLTSAVLPLMQQ